MSSMSRRCAHRGHAERAIAEYRMRVRVALRAFWALWDKRALLNPFRFGVFAWQMWSHKLLRYRVSCRSQPPALNWLCCRAALSMRSA